MSFKCPKMEELARNLAAHKVIDSIADELKQDYQCACEYVPPAPPPQNNHRCNCEGCECPCAPPKQFNQQETSEPPPVMVCYKVPKAKTKTNNKSGKGNNTNQNNNGKTTKSMSSAHHEEGQEVVHRVTQSKSRELRGGVMYFGCDCEKRNGLQDDCQRTGCHGSPPCLTKPPTCGPSEFANAKHLEKLWGAVSKARKRAKELAAAGKDAGGGGGAAGGNGGHVGASGNGGNGDDDIDYEYHCFPACIQTPVEHEAKCCPC